MLKSEIIESILKPLLQPLQEGLLITDSQGIVQFANQAFFELFALQPCEPAALNLSQINGVNLRALLLREALETEVSLERHHCEFAIKFEQQIELPAGRRWFLIHSSLLNLPDEQASLRMILLRDITSEKRLQAVLADKAACSITTEDPEMLQLINRLGKVAPTDAAVLIQGESGTGKTELARLLHKRSARKDQPFIEVNCGAIPASLIETELFGHVKGAFTGAVKNRSGRFKAADGGTLFLDEIAELPKELQPKLLRVLQDGLYEPVGSDQTEKVDVRLVSASNRDLRDLVDEGPFRSDLYYRIAVVPLQVPPLRERPGDIKLLIDVILQRLETRGYSAAVEFTAPVIRAMMNYAWPGNVRELANAVEHCVICAEDDQVVLESLPDTIKQFCYSKKRGLESGVVTSVDEASEIRQALSQAAGNKTLAAQILGIDRSTLWRKMQKLEISA